MIRTCRSWIITEHEQTISRKLKKNSFQKLRGFPRSWKVLSLLVFWCLLVLRYRIYQHFRLITYELSLFVRSPTQTQASQSRQNHFWKASLLFFAFWCSWFVSLSQERDESSEEIARMHALEEKYKAEIAQLAKDSQVVSSFIDILVAIGCYRLFYGTFWHIPNSEKQMCLAG